MLRSSLPLKPFGIRHLNGEHLPPGIVQITEPQYDETIHSQPDAALTYLDEDDGELVTVGSSFELKQRLQDPIPPHDIQSMTSIGASADQLVHIFDIRQSSGSLAVWRDHEAYSSKSRRSSDAETTEKLQELETPTIGKIPSYSISNNEASATQRSGLHEHPVDLYFGNVEYDTTTSDLHELFSECGDVICVKPEFDHRGRNRGWGTVQYRREADANRALLVLNNRLFFSRPLRLERNSVGSETAIIEAMNDVGSSNQIQSTTHLPSTIKNDPNFSSVIEGLDEHLNGLADVLQLASSTLRRAADKTRDCDTTIIEDVLKGVKDILTEVGTFGLDIFQSLENSRVDAASSITNKDRSDTKSDSVVDDQEETGSDTDLAPSEASTTFERHVADDKTNTRPFDLPYMNRQKSCSTDFDVRSGYGPDGFQLYEAPSQSESNLSLQPPMRVQTATKTISNSILDDESDAETDDPMFSARYPPLMSLRRAQTVNSTSQRAYTIPAARSSFEGANAGSNTDKDLYPIHPNVSVRATQQMPKSPDKQDNVENYYRPLPGAWPEASTAGRLPRHTSEESSGAFFDRMMRFNRQTANLSCQNDIARSHTISGRLPTTRLQQIHNPSSSFPNRARGHASSHVNSNQFGGCGPFGFTSLFDRRQPAFKTSLGAVNNCSQPQVMGTAGFPPVQAELRSGSPSKAYLEQPPVDWFRSHPESRSGSCHTMYGSGPFATRADDPRNSSSGSSAETTRLRQHVSVPSFANHVRLGRAATSTEDLGFSTNKSDEVWPSASISVHASNVEVVSTEPDKIDACVATLKDLGFGTGDRNMADRLHVYAVAADGDVTQAVEMIEEDRLAMRDLESQDIMPRNGSVRL